jgi:hypothetical protein
MGKQQKSDISGLIISSTLAALRKNVKPASDLARQDVQSIVRSAIVLWMFVPRCDFPRPLYGYGGLFHADGNR